MQTTTFFNSFYEQEISTTHRPFPVDFDLTWHRKFNHKSLVVLRKIAQK